MNTQNRESRYRRYPVQICAENPYFSHDGLHLAAKGVMNTKVLILKTYHRAFKSDLSITIHRVPI
jgi:hypothetical protein